MPESAIPKKWSNDPLQLQAVPSAEDLKEDGFQVDIQRPIAIIIENGMARVLFEDRGIFYFWYAIASVLRRVSGPTTINGILDALRTPGGKNIDGPEILAAA